jgi:hypothetical protein
MSVDEQFTRRRQLSTYWHNKASDLRGSAGALWAAMNQSGAIAAEDLGLGSGFSFAVACWPVYQMLCGMSLELLLKASIVAAGDDPKPTHRLLELCSQAGLQVDSGQRDILELLSGSIVWEGRYPVPKTTKSFRDDIELRLKVLFDEYSLGKLKAYRSNDALSWEHFQVLWHTFYGIYELRSRRG